MNEQDWRALAAQNPQRVTYPSWKPKEHWDARDKADPWVPQATTVAWYKRDPRKVEVFERLTGFKADPLPSNNPGGTKLFNRPKDWDKPAGRYSRNW